MGLKLRWLRTDAEAPGAAALLAAAAALLRRDTGDTAVTVTLEVPVEHCSGSATVPLDLAGERPARELVESVGVALRAARARLQPPFTAMVATAARFWRWARERPERPALRQLDTGEAGLLGKAQPGAHHQVAERLVAGRMATRNDGSAGPSGR